MNRSVPKTTYRPDLDSVLEQLDRIQGLLEQRKNGGLGYVVVRSGERSIVIPTTTIDWVEARGNYVQIHRGKQSTLLRKSMKVLQAELNSRKFVRIHRSAIVNVERIQELQRMFHGEFRLLLRDGTQLTLSRHYRRNFQEIVGWTL